MNPPEVVIIEDWLGISKKWFDQICETEKKALASEPSVARNDILFECSRNKELHAKFDRAITKVDERLQALRQGIPPAGVASARPPKMNIDSEWRDSPVMPLCYDEPEHIQRDDSPFAFNGWSCVARVLKKKEGAANPKAQAAMAAEWEALTKMKTWSMDQVREWSDVAAEARRENKRDHIGRVFGFVSEKGSELPEGHPDRKFKGRAVFQGNNEIGRAHV